MERLLSERPRSLATAANINKAKRKKVYLCFVLLALCLLVSTLAVYALKGVFFGVEKVKRNPEYNFTALKGDCDLVINSEQFQSTLVPKIEAPLNAALQNMHFHSRSLVLLDLSNNEVLLDVNAYQPAYPASLTKLLTALVALEHLPDLDKETTMNAEMFRQFYAENASMAGYLANEKVKLRDLFSGLMLASGAEAATQLALETTGDLAVFVDLMNAKVKELKLDKTAHFTNVTGLHDTKMTASPYDIAIIFKELLKYPLIREIMAEKQHQAPVTEQHPEGFLYNNIFFKRFENVPDMWRKQWTLVGGKTGYTTEAGQTLASLVEYRGKEYILVTFNSPSAGFYEVNPSASDLVSVFDNLLLPYLN